MHLGKELKKKKKKKKKKKLLTTLVAMEEIFASSSSVLSEKISKSISLNFDTNPSQSKRA